MTQAFIDDPGRVVAAGGTVRAINGSTVQAGRIVRLRMPRSWLARAQVVEYLRSFLIGRTGWASMGTLLLISGAFGSTGATSSSRPAGSTRPASARTSSCACACTR